LIYLVIGKEKAAVIDTGVKSRKNLYEIVAKITDKPVIVLHTHAHFDHIGNSSLFHEVYLHESEVPVMKAHSDKDYLIKLCKTEVNPLLWFFIKRKAENIFSFSFPINYKAFSVGDIFNLGDRVLEIIHTPGHTPGSCCFLDRANKLLFTGDTCCNWGILLHIEFCESVQTFFDSMGTLCDLESNGAFTVNLPGHHAYPAQNGLPGIYRKCADMIIHGTAQLSHEQNHIIAKYEGIRIGLPNDFDKS